MKKPALLGGFLLFPETFESGVSGISGNRGCREGGGADAPPIIYGECTQAGKIHFHNDWEPKAVGRADYINWFPAGKPYPSR